MAHWRSSSCRHNEWLTDEAHHDDTMSFRLMESRAGHVNIKNCQPGCNERFGCPTNILSSLTHLCPPLRSTFAVRETASLGIMEAPRVPPLNPSETIVLSEHYRTANVERNGGHKWVKIAYFLLLCWASNWSFHKFMIVKEFYQLLRFSCHVSNFQYSQRIDTLATLRKFWQTLQRSIIV